MKSITNTEKIRLQKLQSVSVTPDDVLRFYADLEYDLNDYSYTKVGTYLKGQPVAKEVTFEWEYTDDLIPKSVVLKVSLNGDMSDALVYNINSSENTYRVRNLRADTLYYWRIEVINTGDHIYCSEVDSFKTLPGRRIISLDGVKNFRDLGEIKTLNGYKIKQGLLFRGGQIDTEERHFTDSDLNEVREHFKIKTELDLRKPEQLGYSANGRSPIGEDVKYIHLSAVEYNNFVSAKTNEQQIMQVFADFDNYPILFHCQYGADRTGTVAFLLEALVGVEMQELTKDYELTQWQNRKHLPFQALVHEGCGSVDGAKLQKTVYKIFTEKFGLTQMEISNIYNIFINDGAVFKSDSLRQPCCIGESFIEYHINMRKSQCIKRISDEDRQFVFEYSGDTLRIFLNTNTKTIGEIEFDNDIILKYEYNPQI